MSTAKTLEHKTPSQLAAHTAKWAVIMAKVAIRQAIADNPCPHWHILSFTGPAGSESRGLVDLIAIRKDHGKPLPGTKLGDALQIILIQAKGGSAAMPTTEDAKRLRVVALQHGACCTLLAAWKEGAAAQFYSLRWDSEGRSSWEKVKDLGSVFGRCREGIEAGLG